MDIQYIDVDESGEAPISDQVEMKKKALEAKTDLQHKLFSLTRNMKRFPDTRWRGRWNRTEKRCKGAGPEHRLHRAWLEFCIEWARGKGLSWQAALLLAENETRELTWKQENKEEVLKIKTVTEVRQILNKKLDAIYNEDN